MGSPTATAPVLALTQITSLRPWDHSSEHKPGEPSGPGGAAGTSSAPSIFPSSLCPPNFGAQAHSAPLAPAAPRYLRSSGAVLGFLVAPGGSQQLSCCTAACLGSLPSVFLTPAEAALGLLGSGCLPLASYPSLPALQRTEGSFRSRTAPWLAPHPKGARKKPGWCRCPVPKG